MAEDWRCGQDPFSNPDDPEAAAREQRRREREERRREREGRRRDEADREREAAAETPSPAPPPEEPPPPPRTPEEEFWDEEPAQAPPPPPPPAPTPPPAPSRPGGRDGGRRNTWLLLGGLALVILAGVAVAAYAVATRDEPPPPKQPRVITLTIPEGLNREQTAEVAEEAGLRGDYVEATVSSPHLNPARYGAKNAESLEGFLFPDTFELRSRAPVGDLVQLQLEDFKGRLGGVDLRYARSKNLTTYDVITIAAMVEEEAMLDKERPLIAAVIYNRLREGIPLGIDATIRFATGNYTEPLTESELATDSPYNTRLNAGLPPGPIGNPGLASIEAAARPAKVDFLYYVVKPGTCGEHAFSSSDVEFQADVARYNEAREAAGGESPDSC
jgi:UPF0755 protein